MSRIASIHINSQTNAKTAIIFNGDKIENFIRVFNEYTIKDFIDIVTFSLHKGDSIIIDTRGYGIEAYEFINKKYNNYIKTLEYDYKKYISLNYARYKLYQFNVENFVELTKLMNELRNLDCNIQNNNTIRLEQFDETIDKDRAICYLQYLSMFYNSENINIDKEIDSELKLINNKYRNILLKNLDKMFYNFRIYNGDNFREIRVLNNGDSSLYRRGIDIATKFIKTFESIFDLHEYLSNVIKINNPRCLVIGYTINDDETIEIKYGWC
jgi:hypothetical protein